MGGGQRVLPALGRTPCPSSSILGAYASLTPREEPSAERGFSLPLQGPGQGPEWGTHSRRSHRLGSWVQQPHLSCSDLGHVTGWALRNGAVTIIRLVTSPAPRQALLPHAHLHTPSASFC